MNILVEFIMNPWNVGMIVIGVALSITLWIQGKGAEYLRGYIPTLWTSLGILCTFMAIYVSLADYTLSTSNVGINGTNPDGFDINKLIKEVIPAFSTSIIGIIGAIITTILNRWDNDNIERADNNQFLKIKNRILGEKTASSSPEMVLLEIISAIRDNSTKTCEKLKFNNDNASNRLKQILSKIETVDTTTSAVGDRISSAISSAMREQREELTSALTLLIDTVSTKLQTQSDTLATKMDDLRRMLREEVEHIEGTNQTLISRLIDQNETIMDTTTQTLLKESETRNTSLQGFITQQNEKLQSAYAEITAGIGALYQEMEGNINNHIEEEKSLFEHEIKDSIETFAKAQYKTCSDTIEKCNKELAENAKKMHNDQINSFVAFITKLEELFGGICKDFNSNIEGLSDSVVEKLDEISAANVGLLEKTVNHNRQRIQNVPDNYSKEIRATADHIKSEQVKFHANLTEEYSKMQGEMLNQFNNYLKGLETAVEDTRKLLENNSKNAAEVSASIEKALSDLSSDVSKVNTEFLNNLNGLKEQVIESAGTLSKEIQTAIANSSQIKELESMAKNMTEAIDKAVYNMKEGMIKASAVIDKSVSAIDKSAQVYSDSVNKSDMVTRYMESTSKLFMDHNNAISILDKSLKSMETSITQMREALTSHSTIKSKSNPSKR